MKKTRAELRKIIFEEMARLSYASKENGFTYGIDHVEKDKNYEDIIGHT